MAEYKRAEVKGTSDGWFGLFYDGKIVVKSDDNHRVSIIRTIAKQLNDCIELAAKKKDKCPQCANIFRYLNGLDKDIKNELPGGTNLLWIIEILATRFKELQEVKEKEKQGT